MSVIPRPASTVVLLDDRSRVYLTKRPKTMKFMGGFYVFPGGAVEAEDHVIDKRCIRSSHSSEDFSQAYYVAAVRELFEEVGVLLASKDDGLPAKLGTEMEMEYRRLLIKGEISFVKLLKQEGFHLNLDCLTYFGYRITPESSPVRFETRFFLARLPKGQFPKPDNMEIDEAFWMDPSEALAAYENERMLMASPTITSLRTIITYQKGGSLLMPERQR